jgi:hypothetical protein
MRLMHLRGGGSILSLAVAHIGTGMAFIPFPASLEKLEGLFEWPGHSLTQSLESVKFCTPL